MLVDTAQVCFFSVQPRFYLTFNRRSDLSHLLISSFIYIYIYIYIYISFKGSKR